MNDAIAKTLIAVGLALVGVALVSKSKSSLADVLDVLTAVDESEADEPEYDDEYAVPVMIVYNDLIRRINRAERNGKSPMFLARARSDAYRFLQTGSDFHLRQAEHSLSMV